MFLCTLFIERGVYPSNWPIVVFALIGNFSTTLCFAILYMYTGEFYLTAEIITFGLNFSLQEYKWILHKSCI